MLVVETIGKIRRAYFVQGKPIKAICRELKLSRKVVRKVLRSGATSFEYERGVQPLPKIGPWRGDLERLLATNAANMEPGLYTIPAEIDDHIARIKLASLGVEPEELTEEQITYQKSWRWEAGQRKS